MHILPLTKRDGRNVQKKEADWHGLFVLNRSLINDHIAFLLPNCFHLRQFKTQVLKRSQGYMFWMHGLKSTACYKSIMFSRLELK